MINVLETRLGMYINWIYRSSGCRIDSVAVANAACMNDLLAFLCYSYSGMVLRQNCPYRPRFPICCAEIPDLFFDRIDLIFKLEKGSNYPKKIVFIISKR